MSHADVKRPPCLTFTLKDTVSVPKIDSVERGNEDLISRHFREI